MVGCGALGCEKAKTLGLSGACLGSSGCLYLADNDRIELSNLNR